MTSPHDTAPVLRVFLASPGDVDKERAYVRELIESRLPNDPWATGPALYKLIAWNHPHGGTPMLANMTPQQAVTAFSGRPADCDIVIVILWSRLGSHLALEAHPRPGGGRYESGTEWEYQDALASKRNPDVLVFHKTEQVLIDADQPDADERIRQRRLVTAFLDRFKNPDGAFRGGYNSYPDLDAFKSLAEDRLKQIIRRRLATHTPPTGPVASEQPTTGTAIPAPERLIGRVDDSARIVAALTTGASAAVLVQGPGGIGKTTLTQEAGNHAAVVARYGTRRWFAELETAPDRDTFDAQLCLALGLDATQGLTAVTHRLAQGPALLLLDNLETSWERAGSAIEDRLRALAAVPDLTVVASFRGQDFIGGVNWTLQLDVKPLGKAEAQALFREIAPGIAPDDPDLPNLLDALGGMPLAINLTARRAARRPNLAGLWAEWQRIGAGVAEWKGGEPGRLTSVTQSIAFSLQSPRMTPQSHRLFALLGQSPAGLAPSGVAALLGDAAFTAEEGLRAVGLAYDRHSRLDLLPPVRDYARRHCPPETTDAIAWCSHFLGRARTEGERIGGDGGAEALAALTPEIANIDAALLASLDLSLRHDAVQAVRGHADLLHSSGARSVAALLTLATVCKHAGDASGAAECYLRIGEIALARSDHDTAWARYNEALQLFCNVGSTEGEANCISGLGDIAFGRSNHNAARAHYYDALPLYRQLGDPVGEANCILGLGDIALQRSEHDTARVHYNEALPLYRQTGAVVGEANCILGLGDIGLQRSEHDTARTCYEQAIPLYRQAGDLLGEANCIQGLGKVALACSEYGTAQARYQEALPLYGHVGNLQAEAHSIQGLGNVALACSEYDLARSYYDKAIPLYRRVRDPEGQADCALGYAAISRARNDQPDARRHCETALQLYTGISNLSGVARAHERLAAITSGPEQAAHAQSARDAWLAINLPDQANRVTRQFP